MIDDIDNFQASFFASGSGIEPSPETIATMLELFKGTTFLPSTVQRLRFSSTGAKQALQLQLVTSLKDWSITFDQQRIIIKRDNVKDTPMCTAAEFITATSSYFQKIATQYGLKGTRLSFVCKAFSKSIEEGAMKIIQNKIINDIPFYAENHSIEWNTRSTSRIAQEFSDKKELINVITSISRAQVLITTEPKNEPTNCIEITLDINTFQNNKAARFSSEDIGPFLQSAEGISQKIIKQIEEKYYV